MNWGLGQNSQESKIEIVVIPKDLEDYDEVVII